MEMLTPAVIGIGVIAMAVAWIVNTWIRVKHGYPLENSWGKPVYPRSDQAAERVTLLSQENAALQAELGSLKDRLANVERIVTDRGFQLSHEIEQLRKPEHMQ
jgi:hypothetical protein